MNVKESIKFLNSIGYFVEKCAEGYHVRAFGESDYCPSPNYKNYHPKEYLTARELVKRAKVYTSENRQNTAIKKNVKHFQKGKERRAVRDTLKGGTIEEMDELSNYRPPVEEDIWTWD